MNIIPAMSAAMYRTCAAPAQVSRYARRGIVQTWDEVATGFYLGQSEMLSFLTHGAKVGLGKESFRGVRVYVVQEESHFAVIYGGAR